jgi:hypothetical protein
VDAAFSLATVSAAIAKQDLSVPAAPTKDKLEVVFHRDYRVDDGRYNNNGWLQELPDPITKMTWENVILLSVKTAKELGLKIQNNENKRIETPWVEGPRWQTLAAVLAAGAIFLEIIVVIGLKAGGGLAHTDQVERAFGTPAWIGQLFLTDHLLAFEITSIVLLVAAVGGVILGSHTRRRGGEQVSSG